MTTAADPLLSTYEQRRTSKPGPPASRRYLVYCPTKSADFLGDFFSPERLFDVAFNDWWGDGRGSGLEQAEYVFTERGHKWPCAKTNLAKLPRRYDFYAFIDDDIEIGVQDLNRLFLAGEALRLELYQASLGERSISAYAALFSQPGSLARPVRFVEIMMPIFSRAALDRCLPTFDESESGWGLDFLWAKLLEFQGLAVIDAVVANHFRPVQSTSWISSRGLTPEEEMRRIAKDYRLDINSKSRAVKLAARFAAFVRRTSVDNCR